MKRDRIHIIAWRDTYVVDPEPVLHDAKHFERGLILASIGFITICVFGAAKFDSFDVQGPAVLIGFALVIIGLSWSAIRLASELFRRRTWDRGGAHRAT